MAVKNTSRNLVSNGFFYECIQISSHIFQSQNAIKYLHQFLFVILNLSFWFFKIWGQSSNYESQSVQNKAISIIEIQ